MNRTRPTSTTAAAHPLEAAVIEVFKKRSPQDRTTLACGLSDPDPRSFTMIEPDPDGPRLGISPHKAYLLVAEDVLGWMFAQGKLTRDELGWYRLAEVAEPVVSEGIDDGH